MSYLALEDDDDHVYLNMLVSLMRRCAHINIFTNHRPFVNVGNDIFEYITNIYIDGYECDYELNECDCGIYLVIDDRFKYIWENTTVVIKLRKEVLLIEKLYCVFARIPFNPANGEDICNTDKLALHDECKSRKLTNETTDDRENEYKYKYIYYCKCNYRRCRPTDNVTLYDDEDMVLYDGLGNKRIISDIIDKNRNKFLTLKCCRI